MFDLPIYCENSTSFFLNEPVNAITNLLFFISAFLIFKRKNFYKEFRDPIVKIFFIMIICTGIGSTLFHSFRSGITHKLDALPIYILFTSLFYSSLRPLLSRGFSFLGTIAFLITQIILSQNVTRETFNLNGSINHLFTLFIFVVLFFLLKKSVNIIQGKIAIKIFFGAIIFRIIDLRVCQQFSIGSHFMWHILCAIAVYFSYLFLIECRKRSI
mgnify:CR=1 FL=1